MIPSSVAGPSPAPNPSEAPPEERLATIHHDESCFLASMSHEIRTPMNSLIGMLEMLTLTELSEVQQNIVRIASDSAKVLARIADDILHLEKMRAGHIELESIPVDIARLVRDIASLLAAENTRQNVEIHTDIDSDLARSLITDPVRMRQILTNLASNAIKFTHTGSITISARAIDTQATTQYIRIGIIDTGIGMSNAALNRAWKPFTQAHPSTSRLYGGTGLGLNIARQWADRLGGRLSISSEPGKGTTATLDISLPVARPHREESCVQPQTTSASLSSKPAEKHALVVNERTGVTPPTHIPDEHTGRPYLLIADDHPSNRLVIEMQLGRLGYRFDSAIDGEAALRSLRARRYDLLLTDCSMPHRDGYELSTAWRRIEAAGALPMPIVGLSANVSMLNAALCAKAGMNDCLVKPIGLTDLACMLDTWLAPPSDGLQARALIASRRASAAPTPMDLSLLGKRFGTHAALTRILQSFVETAQEDLLLLTPFLDGADPFKPSCRTRIHRIVGSLQILGICDLANEGSVIEHRLTLHTQKKRQQAAREQLRNALDDFCMKVLLQIDWLVRHTTP